MDNKIPDVPYIVFESACVKLERTIRRLWILCIIMFITLIASNLVWLYYESQWAYVDTTTTNEVSQSIDSEGDATIGDVNINGEGE